MARGQAAIEPPPMTTFRIDQSEFHAFVAKIARVKLVNPGHEHDETEIDLKCEQDQRLQSRRSPARELESEDGSCQPVSHESRRAHATEHAAPAHVQEEVARIDQ